MKSILAFSNRDSHYHQKLADRSNCAFVELKLLLVDSKARYLYFEYIVF